MKNSIILLLVFVLAASGNAYAQLADSLDLGEVLITASKVPTTERETTKPYTIISQAEIKQNPGSSVADLLDKQNGVIINGASSNPGKDKSVYLRGAATQYTLILIDGYPVSDPSGEGGAFDLRLIPLENVERIEIVKGSMSTLYGSDAISGVINIITKKPDERTFNINGKAGYGSFNTNELSVGANGQTDVVNYSANISRHFTKGVSEAEPQDDADFGKDGFERVAASASLEFKAAENFRITPFLNYSTYDGDYDGGAFTDAENRYEADLLNTGVRAHYKTGNLEIREAFSLTKTERKFSDSFGVFNPSATIMNNDLFSHYNISDNVRLLAGINYQKLNFEINDVVEGTSIISPYTTLFLRSDLGLITELGFRLNSHDEYGSNVTYNIAPSFNVNENLKLLASVSSGFKAPTLNELFGPFGANPDLKPQKSTTIDTGVEFRLPARGLSASLVYFVRSIDDLISYDSNSGYINVNEQNDQGVEFTVDYMWNRGKLQFFYNYLDGEITQSGQKFDNLIRRPDHSFGANAFVQLNQKWIAKVSGMFMGEREDIFFDMTAFQSERVDLDSYLLMDVGTSYTLFNNSITVFADVKNLLNAEYTEVYGFNTPGIHFKAGITFSY